MKKIAVIFPGVGYTKDRPLLYYSGKLAASSGYELIHIDFSGLKWSKEQLKDQDYLRSILKICLKKTNDALSGTDLLNSDVIFISKSIGTVVATAYEHEKHLKVKQVCFSPLEFIEDHVRDGGADLFYGDADPFADHKTIERIAHERSLETFRIEGGNHSLETGDIITDIDNMKRMMREVCRYCGFEPCVVI